MWKTSENQNTKSAAESIEEIISLFTMLEPADQKSCIDALQERVERRSISKPSYLGNMGTNHIGDLLAFSKNPDGTCSVKSFIGFGETEVSIPVEWNGVPVTGIDPKAFLNCTHIERVNIADGIEIIGREAFSGCVNLQYLRLPDTLKYIGDYAFSKCSALGEIRLPEGIKQICSYAFAETGLTDIELPDGTELADRVFYCCKQLKSVKLPSEIKVIREALFAGCEQLAEIQLPKNMKKIEKWAFSGCNSLSNLYLPDGLEEIGEDAFGKSPSWYGLEMRVRIPASVTKMFMGEKRGTFVYSGKYVTYRNTIFGNTNEDDNITIICSPGSYAQKYARQCKISCARDV